MFIISNRHGRKCLTISLQLEPFNDMFKVISDIMAQWYEMIISFIITINFCNAMKMNCALILIFGYHYGRKCLSILLLLEPWNDTFKFISDVIALWYELINIFIITISFCNAMKIHCALI